MLGLLPDNGFWPKSGVTEPITAADINSRETLNFNICGFYSIIHLAAIQKANPIHHRCKNSNS